MVPDAGVVSMFDRDMKDARFNADGEMTISSINTTTVTNQAGIANNTNAYGVNQQIDEEAED